MGMSRIKIAAKVITVNLILAGAAVFLLPFVTFKFKYGKYSLTHEEIKNIASGVEVQQAHGQKGFREAIKSLDNKEIYCNQPHPVIGWIDICGSDQFWGFSNVTQKAKDPDTFRLLLVGGSVANYMGCLLYTS